MKEEGREGGRGTGREGEREKEGRREGGRETGQTARGGDSEDGEKCDRESEKVSDRERGSGRVSEGVG